MNGTFLPEIAARHGCALVEVRSAWLDYLKHNRLEPKDLLRDGVHLNDHGNYLLAELVKRYLRYDPKLVDGVPENSVRTVVVGRDAPWRDGQLVLDFAGNRIDAVLGSAEAAQASPLEVRIDGRAALGVSRTLYHHAVPAPPRPASGPA